MLIPIVPMPAAMAAAVEEAVLLAELDTVDDTNMAVALVDVANVVAVESVDMPDIGTISIPDISMLTLQLSYRNQRKVIFKRVGVTVRRLPSGNMGGINVRKRRTGRIGLGC